jgi:hypothetical protein
MIDINHGLLDELFSLRVLSRDQIDVVRSKTRLRSSFSAAGLRHQVVVRPTKMFLVALNKTGQQHVNNYIIACGQPSETDIENWPLIASCEN